MTLQKIYRFGEESKMKIDILEDVNTIYASELKIGEMAVIVEENRKGEVLLRAYNVFVSLTKPNSTWLNDDLNFKVRRVKRVELVSE